MHLTSCLICQKKVVFVKKKEKMTNKENSSAIAPPISAALHMLRCPVLLSVGINYHWWDCGGHAMCSCAVWIPYHYLIRKHIFIPM